MAAAEGRGLEDLDRDRILNIGFLRNLYRGETRILNCPRCGSPVSEPPEREWTFQQYRVSRFRCDKGDKFNLYSGASKTFTIPRHLGKGFCASCRTQNPGNAVYCKNCGTKL